MTTTTGDLTRGGAQAELTGSLTRYYLARAIVAAAWVVAAVAVGRSNATAAAAAAGHLSRLGRVGELV